MPFRYEGNQKVFIIKNGHPVTILGRSEFFTGKQNRYYIRSETAIPGKNINEDWINEDQLTHIEPVIESETASIEKPDLNRRPGIRKKTPGGQRA